jgi:surface protein
LTGVGLRPRSAMISKTSLVLALLLVVLVVGGGTKSSSFVRFAEASHSTDISDYYNFGFYELVQECLAVDPVEGECPSHWYSVQQGVNKLTEWDVSNIKNMYDAFYYGASQFNGDLSSWDVSSVTDMEYMFGGAYQFNGDLSSWDVSSVKDMAYMFYGAFQFNRDLSSWDVSLVTSMRSMFGGASNFNRDLSSWDVSSVRDMEYMFSGAYLFNGDLSNWDVSSVTTFNGMFSWAHSFEGKGLETWDTSNVKVTRDMFWEASSFDGKISNWNTDSVTDMVYMFDKASSFAQDVSGWTKHDGNTLCDYDQNWSQECSGGVGADTSVMFLDATKFLSMYNCGINGPPKECTPSGTAASSGFSEYAPAETFDPSVYTVEWFNSAAASDYYTLDDMTIWGTPRLDIESGTTITNMKFKLNEEYAKMIGGCVLPGVLVAVFIFALTFLYFAFKFATCCLWVVTGSCECCFKSKVPSACQKKTAKFVVVLCALISIVGCGLIYWGASELPIAVNDVVKDLGRSLDVMDVDVDVIDAAYTNAAGLIPDGGQDEKVEISNTRASVKSTVNTFENEVEKYVEQTEQAAIALASFLLVVSLICGGLVFGNFKKCIFFASVPLWLLLLISWIMFGVFMGVAQFFDDLEVTVIDWRSAEGFYPPAANPMTSLDDVLPCFSDRVALDTITGARQAIYDGINRLNIKLNDERSYVTQFVNAEYKSSTASQMCGAKTGEFKQVGVDGSISYDEYKALACNLYERGLLGENDEVFETTNLNGYDQVWSSGTKSHTVSLQEAYLYYFNTYGYALDIASVSGTIDMISALPNIDSLARCKYVEEFVTRVSAEEDYVSPITGETIQAPDETPLNRLLKYSEVLAVAWFLIGLSYIILYVVMMKYMFWMQAEDREKLTDAEMQEVWGSYHEK